MNYNTLRNKPTINYKEIIGDNTVTDVGGITEEEFDDLLDTDLASYYTKAEIDELFSRSFIEKEKSGSIVTFDCPSSKNGISEVTSEIVAVQSGTGDPSPTNVRPISGWSAVNVVVSPTTDVEDGTTYTTTLKDGQDNPMTCYGGELSNENGVQSLVNTLNHVVPVAYRTGTASSGIAYVDCHLQGLTQDANAICDTYKQINMTDIAVDGTFRCYNNELTFYDNRFTDLTTANQILANVNVVYELATPTQIPQDNLTIASSAGINNIWCDSGDITVKALDRIIQG